MASAAVLPFYYRELNVAQESLSHDLVLPFLVHAGIWSCVAVTAGLAFEIGLRSRQRLALVALHGLLGGLLGTAIYEVLAAIAFPAGRTTEPLAGAWAPRLIGRLTVSIASAAFSCLWPSRPPGRPQAPRARPNPERRPARWHLARLDPSCRPRAPRRYPTSGPAEPLPSRKR